MPNAQLLPSPGSPGFDDVNILKPVTEQPAVAPETKPIGGTKHIGANLGDIAEICLVPGDPLRAKVIAETYLDNPKLVTSVRNMLG